MENIKKKVNPEDEEHILHKTLCPQNAAPNCPITNKDPGELIFDNFLKSVQCNDVPCISQFCDTDK